MASNQSVQAWDRFLKVCKNTQVHVNPPAMDYMYLPEVEEELYNACKAAADAGVPTGKLLEPVQKLYDRVDQPMSNELSSLLLSSANLDADVGGQSLLHHMFKQPCPPRLSRGPLAGDADNSSADDTDAEEDEVGLAELLAKHPTPNLRDSDGNTVLHILILRTLQAQYFPDGGMAAAMSTMPGFSIENWAPRAKYVEGAFKMLVAAGWSVRTPGINSLTALNLLDLAQRLTSQLVHNRETDDMMANGTAELGPDWGDAFGSIMAPMKKSRQAILKAFTDLQHFAKDLP